MHEAPERSEPDLVKIRAEKYATFLNNLDKWVEATIIQDNIDDKEIIKRVKDSYRRSLEANMQYYDEMAKASAKANDKNAEKRHRRMADVYNALFE